MSNFEFKEHIHHFTPRKIYYQKAVENYPITRRLLDYKPWESIPKIAYDKKEEMYHDESQPRETNSDPRQQQIHYLGPRS